MTAWHVTFEVDVPDARNDADAIAYALMEINDGEGVITVEPTDPPSRFASLDPRTRRP
jgi:hypothetical protein